MNVMLRCTVNATHMYVERNNIRKQPTPTQLPEPMKLFRTFALDLNGTDVEIDAQISLASYVIMDVRAADGYPVNFTEEDMEAFEMYVEEQITTTTTQAMDLETGRMETFSIVSWGPDIIAVLNGTYSLPRCSPQFTEACEAFHLDREFEMAIESDAPRAAAGAGFLRAVSIPAPSPQRTGFGLRRAA